MKNYDQKKTNEHLAHYQNEWPFVKAASCLSVVTIWRPLVGAILSVLLMVVRLLSLLWVVVTP